MYLGGEQTIEQIIAAGVKVPQDIANKLGSFDQQSFRLAAVMWLVDLHIEIERIIIIHGQTDEPLEFIMIFGGNRSLLHEQIFECCINWTTRGGKRMNLCP
jgi:hypothetical protein